MIKRIRRSQATYPVFDDLITQDEFLLLVTLVALQAFNFRGDRNPDPGVAVLESLQWLLAYWRADAGDLDRNNRVEMFFYGRTGFSELSLEETQAEIIGQMTEGYYTGPGETAMVRLTDVNNFLSWAWEKFIPWEPEKTYSFIPNGQMAMIVADAAISFSQFVDHFEEYEVRQIMAFLTSRNFGLQTPLWHVMQGPRSIEVEVMDNGDRVIHVVPEDADLPNIDILYPAKAGEPLQLKILGD